MKLNLALLGGAVALFSFIPVQAQYISKGWTPGQAATLKQVQATGWVPGQVVQQDTPATGAPEGEDGTAAPPSSSPSSFFDFGNLLVAGLKKVGVNITLPEGQGGMWDERIPLITDDNYEDIVVNEKFASDEEASERTWALVITAGAGKQNDAISKFVDQMFDSAFNISQFEGDLPNIRWGRVDYYNVTYLTTKWSVWQAPYLVVLKDHGQTLRFYRPHTIRVRDDAFLEFLRTKGYQATPPWTGLWAPGGDREWILDYFALYLAKFYNVFVKIPKIFLYVISGGLGSLVLSFLHRPSKAQKEAALKEAHEKSAKAAKAASEAAKAPAKDSEKKKQSARSLEKVSESSPERGTSPSKTRASARQRKGKKPT